MYGLHAVLEFGVLVISGVFTAKAYILGFRFGLTNKQPIVLFEPVFCQFEGTSRDCI